MITRNTLLALLGLASLAHSATAAEAVGEVSLVIGDARLMSENGTARPLARHAAIQSGDRIDTEGGGHVHIRFVDGGMVSIRPGSRLVVESYQHSGQGQQTAIKFRLDQGVMRSITGQWGEAARDRFRLNTPIAAIGVRGTDFVVEASPSTMRVAVYSGAVVAAPLGGGCQAETLGPCTTGSAKALAAEMGSVMLEIKNRQDTPQVVPLNPLLLAMVQATPPAAATLPASLATTSASGSSTANPPSDANLSTSSTVNETTALSQVRPAVAPLPSPPLPSTLSWGRWSGVAPEGDTLSQPLSQASTGKAVTVGDNTYVLFRETPDRFSLRTDLGATAFRFETGFATLEDTAGRSAAQITGGSLAVNFSAREFATTLGLMHPATGSVTLSRSGRLTDDGMFAARDAQGVVAGAVSTDGSQVGYLFQQLTPQGTLSGLTQWRR